MPDINWPDFTSHYHSLYALFLPYALYIYTVHPLLCWMLTELISNPVSIPYIYPIHCTLPLMSDINWPDFPSHYHPYIQWYIYTVHSLNGTLTDLISHAITTHYIPVLGYMGILTSWVQSLVESNH